MSEKTKSASPPKKLVRYAAAAVVATDAMEDWSPVIDFLQKAESLNGTRFSQTENIPGTNLKLLELDERLRSILGLISGVAAPRASSPVPHSFVAEIKNPVDQIHGAIKQCKQWQDAVSAGGGVGQLTPQNWVIVPKNNSGQLNFASPLQTISGQLDTAAALFWRVAPAIDQKTLPYYEGAIEALSKLVVEAREHAKTAEDMACRIKADAEAAKSECDQAQKDGREIAELLESSSKKNAAISEHEQQSLAGWENLSEILDRANELDPQVSAAKQRLADWDKEIDRRAAKLDLKIEDAEALETRLKELREATSDLAEQARGMLNMSIKAGLAASFSAAVDKLDRRVKFAQGAFYVSIILLIASSIPLASYLFADFGNLVGLEMKDPNEEVRLTKALAMLVIMLPFVWLTRFSANQYDALFSLREHYQHKLSLAASVDGFKDQAAKYSDIIATETFYQLTVNPAEKLVDARKNGRHPSPVMEWLMERVTGDRKKASDQAADAGQQ